MSRWAVIGVGSNIGDRRANIARALALLAGTEGVAVLRTASIIETTPVDFLAQPNFLNTLVLVDTDKSPEALLACLHEIEYKLGRKRNIPKGPRTMDLDIILYDNIVITGSELTIPHKERLNRTFVLGQLAELVPDMKDPETGRTYKEMVKNKIS